MNNNLLNVRNNKLNAMNNNALKAALDRDISFAILKSPSLNGLNNIENTDLERPFLEMNNFQHNKDRWYMDVIRYRLDNDKKRVCSGLAWHCENDNYPNVITVLLYLTIDETIKEGNLRYKDKHNNKLILKIKSGTTVIMDGNVPHKPQDPYGTGKRDLIIVSFEK